MNFVPKVNKFNPNVLKTLEVLVPVIKIQNHHKSVTLRCEFEKCLSVRNKRKIK